MKLEKEIKQKKFNSPVHKLIVNLIYSGNWMEAHMLSYLKPFNISPQQYNVLRILRGQHPKPVSVNLITARMLDKMSNASRLVEKLRQKGWVDRKLCKKDRRRVDVLITDKGLEILREIEKDFGNLEKAATKELKNTEIDQLNALLDKIRGS
jgi:DNA-binding MarR family transcriptional regulator